MERAEEFESSYSPRQGNILPLNYARMAPDGRIELRVWGFKDPGPAIERIG